MLRLTSVQREIILLMRRDPRAYVCVNHAQTYFCAVSSAGYVALRAATFAALQRKAYLVQYYRAAAGDSAHEIGARREPKAHFDRFRYYFLHPQCKEGASCTY